MKKIDAAEFKEQCLALLDQLDADGLIVTNDGMPIARAIPYLSQEADLIGSLRNKINIRGDLYSTGMNWDVGAES